MAFKGWDRRSQFLVDPRLQRRLIVSATIPVLVILGLLLPLQLYLDHQLAQELAQHDLELKGAVSRPTSTLLFFIFAVGYVLLVSLRLSHRVAGAASRIRKTLEAYRAGEHDVRAKLREGDFLIELADDVNSFLDWSQRDPTSSSASRNDPRPEASSPGDRPSSVTSAQRAPSE